MLSSQLFCFFFLSFSSQESNAFHADFFAHSNYCELALIEMGERDVFPHVGRNTKMEIEGARDSVYPIVTGTFGGVDFLHSVTGEGL